MHTYSEEDKTLFTFIDETGEQSKLTLDKSVADALTAIVGDVHAWIQTVYDGISAGEVQYAKYINHVVKRGGDLTRLAIGNIIRLIAFLTILNSIDA